VRSACLAVPASDTVGDLLLSLRRYSWVLDVDHFGVVKAFLDADLLPRVITGTSAGGVVAAMVCTRTDDELRELLRPELASKLTAFSEPFGVWTKRLWQTGARFDAVHWAKRCSFFTRGSMTFKEAYMRTGRVLNISVVPADRHSSVPS
jgi:predicted acylesterase/phospholipase RssA